MGFTGVSFYVDWALLEGAPGTIVQDGIFSLSKFFAAAQQAGVYLIARPGPYINAEASGGGFPGWIQRVNGLLRTAAPDYIDATRLYSKTIGDLISNAQVPNGPVILFQPENEFSGAVGDSAFPNSTNAEYMNTVAELFLDEGIWVPTLDNDNNDGGSFRPGSGSGEVNIYGIDAYPLRYDCKSICCSFDFVANQCEGSKPDVWPDTKFYQSLSYRANHLRWSPSSPFTVVEFQGGAPDPWGGVGESNCAALVNNEVTRVVYKHLYSIGVKIFNVYMVRLLLLAFILPYEETRD